MYYFDENLHRSEIGKISRIVANWCRTREKIMNVVTVPYNSDSIFVEAILQCARYGKRVMYITSESEENISIINTIRKNTDFRNYSYIRNSKEINDSKLIVCSPEKLNYIDMSFDLYIYDDINSFSEFIPVKLLEKLILNESSRLICCSSYSVFKGEREIVIPARNNGRPLAEPRLISTRLDLKKEMPINAFQFIQWSVENQRRFIIYVPHAEMVESVYSYMVTYVKDIGGTVLFSINNENSPRLLQRFMKKKGTVMITDDCGETFSDCRDTDVLVCKADDETFNSKKLLYILSRVGRRDEGRRGEVIFLGSGITLEMEKAKNMARYFNREAWETGLLKM